MPFTATELEIPGVILVSPAPIGDERGFFMETYKSSEFEALGIRDQFRQENHSRSARGVIRGLHFQKPPYGQAKLVRAIVGEIFDVAVDLRRDSPTYCKWVSVRLSAENKRLLYLPPWCAHGFAVVSPIAEVVYKTSCEWARDYESGVMWDDPDVAIQWPFGEPVLSERDKHWPSVHAAEIYTMASSKGAASR